MFCMVLRELASFILRPLSITFERLWQLGVPCKLEKKGNCFSHLQKTKGELTGQSCLLPGKLLEEFSREAISIRMKDVKVTENLDWIYQG